MSANFRVFGIICELNPPHRGHSSLFEQAKDLGATHCVAVMSGNYVQRGGPAVFDKWARTKAALRMGADLVIELPLPFSMGGAETFAAGGCSLLHRLGFVDTLLFGSESGEIRPLQKLAAVLDSPSFSAALETVKAQNPGLPFASLRQMAAAELTDEATAALLKDPNNILGVSYCAALNRLGSSVVPKTVRREGAGYHDAEPDEESPSSTALRKLLRSNLQADLSPYMDQSCAEILQKAVLVGKGPVFPEAFEQAVLSRLRSLSPEDLRTLPDVSEGLDQKLWQSVRTARTLEELYDGVKSKRYSHARIRRLVWSAFLGITAEDTAAPPPYCRVLGRSKKGAQLLPKIKHWSDLPLIMRHSDTVSLSEQGKRLYQLECVSDDLYALGTKKIQPCGLDQTTGLIVL